MIATSVVYVFNQFAESIRLEAKCGMYSVCSFLIAITLIELPVMFLHAVVLLVPSFAIGNWHWSAFGPCLLLWAAIMWAWESIAQLMSIAPHFVLGMLNYQGMWFIGVVVCGIVLRPQDVIWPFRSFFYIVPYSYGFKAIGKTFWSRTPNYGGAELCDSSDPLCSLGYTCPEATSLQGCWGVTGQQIMTATNVVYDGIDPNADVAFNVVMVLVITAVAKVCYTVQLYFFCRRS